jgi:signal recognition particle subunit SEC65
MIRTKMILTRLIGQVLRLRQGNNLSQVPTTNGLPQMQKVARLRISRLTRRMSPIQTHHPDLSCQELFRWTCVYPIYLDAKRPYGAGQRRVARAKSLWWPLSKDIADATTRLGLGTLHEISKAHPRDWENPGRVRVQWKKDGKPVNPVIKTSELCA